MEIKILGSGCANCKKLEKNVLKALENMNVTAEVDHVTEYEEIMKYNIMSLPGLVVDGVVKSAGKVLKPKDIETLLN